MNALEKYAAKKTLTDALIEKLAQYGFDPTKSSYGQRAKYIRSQGGDPRKRSTWNKSSRAMVAKWWDARQARKGNVTRWRHPSGKAETYTWHKPMQIVGRVKTPKTPTAPKAPKAPSVSKPIASK